MRAKMHCSEPLLRTAEKVWDMTGVVSGAAAKLLYRRRRSVTMVIVAVQSGAMQGMGNQ